MAAEKIGWGTIDPAIEIYTVGMLKAILASVLLLSGVAAAHEGHHHHHHAPKASKVTSALPLPLKVTGLSVMAVPASVKDTAAYMTLSNPTDKDIVLVDAEAKVAGESMLMHTVMKDGMMGMTHAEKLVIPARGQLILAHDGDHVMLMKLKRPLVVGEKIEIVLIADNGQRLTVTAPVQKH